MEYVESYLYEVSQHIPADHREEVIIDLRATLEEEVYGEAGDGLITDEVQLKVLARFGHPLKTASRFVPSRALIGAELYPAFIQTWKFLIFVALIALFVVSIGIALIHDWQVGPWEFVTRTVSLLVWVSAVVIGVFVALEYSGEKLGWYERWRPQKLVRGNLGIAKHGDLITNLITEGVFLLWWNGIIVFSSWWPAAQAPIQLGSSWAPYFWCLNGVVALSFVLHSYVLMTGLWRFRTLIAEIVLNTAFVGLGVVILLQPDLVSATEEFAQPALQQIDRIVRMSILVILGFACWDIWIAIRTLRGEPAVNGEVAETQQVR